MTLDLVVILLNVTPKAQATTTKYTNWLTGKALKIVHQSTRIKISQSKKDKYFDFTHMRYQRVVKFTETESRMVVARG